MTIRTGMIAGLVAVVAIVGLLDGDRISAKGKAKNPRAGTYAIQWDWTNNGSADFQNFASFLNSGEVLADGPVVPASLAGSNTPLGPGHGSWKFANNKYKFNIAFGEADGGSEYWLLSGTIAPGSGNVFDGTARLKRFSSTDDTTPDVNTTLGISGDVQEGTGI